MQHSTRICPGWRAEQEVSLVECFQQKIVITDESARYLFFPINTSNLTSKTKQILYRNIARNKGHCSFKSPPWICSGPINKKSHKIRCEHFSSFLPFGSVDVRHEWSNSPLMLQNKTFLKESCHVSTEPKAQVLIRDENPDYLPFSSSGKLPYLLYFPDLSDYEANGFLAGAVK